MINKKRYCCNAKFLNIKKLKCDFEMKWANFWKRTTKRTTTFRNTTVFSKMCALMSVKTISIWKYEDVFAVSFSTNAFQKMFRKKSFEHKHDFQTKNFNFCIIFTINHEESNNISKVDLNFAKCDIRCFQAIKQRG